MSIEFKDVARALSCREFADSEMTVGRNKRVPCPFHGGKDNNLGFFGDGRCHCFVCGKTADVVQLAAAVWNTSQVKAAEELNDRFRLGLSSETMTAEDRRQRDQERERRRQEADEAREAERKTWSQAADDLRNAEDEAARLTLADADKPSTWATVARLARAQDQWHSLRAAARGCY